MTATINSTALCNSTALWKSGFRPFFLLGSLYGPLILLTWILSFSGQIDWLDATHRTAIWHQHEIIFGFTLAIIFGFMLTALPTWAGTEDICGNSLALLTIAWIVGRIAVWSHAPLLLVACLDLLFPVLFLILVAPGILQADNRVYRAIFPIIACFIVANFLYYMGQLHNDQSLLQMGLRLGLYSVILHCTIVGGFLTPIFTQTVLKQHGNSQAIAFIPTLEWLAVLSILPLAMSDILALDKLFCGVIALFCSAIHAFRLSRWQGLRILHDPLVLVMHLGYSWLIFAFVLRALQDFGLLNNSDAWIHAFTVGALGLMMLGFMSRIALRHTGRELIPHPLMVASYWMMCFAALLRISVSIFQLGNMALVLSALLWSLPFLIYLFLYGHYLITPGLPEKIQNQPVF